MRVHSKNEYICEHCGEILAKNHRMKGRYRFWTYCSARVDLCEYCAEKIDRYVGDYCRTGIEIYRKNNKQE